MSIPDLGGSTPYGYVRTKNGFQIDPEEAAIVREIFLFRDWNWSLRRIAENLNHKQRPTPRGGDLWRHTTIKQILDNEHAYRASTRYPAILL